MSDNKDNRNEKLSDAKATAELLLKKHQRSKRTVETVKNRSPKDYFLWLLILVAVVCAGLVNGYLAAYWPPANSVWTRVAIIIGLVVFSLVCFALTSHAKDFKILVKDASVELRRVTWPSKQETINWTWVSVIAMGVFAFLIWIFDMFFNKVVGFIIGG